MKTPAYAPTREYLARCAKIRLLVKNGRSMASVAREFGLSRQRVHQIVKSGR